MVGDGFLHIFLIAITPGDTQKTRFPGVPNSRIIAFDQRIKESVTLPFLQIILRDIVNALPFTLRLKVGVSRSHLHFASGIARERIIGFKDFIQDQRLDILILGEKNTATVAFRSHGLHIESFEFRGIGNRLGLRFDRHE